MEPFIGQIMMFGGNFAPRGWALCDGQLLPISQNQTLFSILGTTYGGDGETTFGLPDLRGRLAMHAGTGPGLTPRQLGSKGGSESITPAVAQMASHTHAATSTSTAKAHPTEGNATAPGGLVWAKSGQGDPDYGPLDGSAEDMHAGAIVTSTTNANTGGGVQEPNMPPYQAVNFIIALVGVFPSRD